MRLQFIKENRSLVPVKKICHVLKFTLIGYYCWPKALLSPRRIERENFGSAIRELFVKHNNGMGNPIITVDLHDDFAFSGVSRPWGGRLMREMGLKCPKVKMFVVIVDAKHNEPVAPNPLDRKFLKKRFIHYGRFQNIAEAEQALFRCIKVSYNREREHSTNGINLPLIMDRNVEQQKSGLTSFPLFCG